MENIALRRSHHDFQPEELLNFVELRGFTNDWDKDLGLTDDDLSALQHAIMLDPRCGTIVEGTGGLRKLRFSPGGWKKGKRDAIRVCYVYFQEYGLVLLVAAYSKAQKDDLTQGERIAIRKLIAKIQTYLESEHYR